MRRSHTPSSSLTEKDTSQPKAPQTPLLDLITIISAVLSYLIALILYFLAPISWRHRATFPILLAPPGTILRYSLARLNTRHRLPIGTFLANMIATLIIAGVTAAQRRPRALGNGIQCNALWAIQQGFCGCLSTVSTFAVEASTVKGWKLKWGYVFGSVISGHLLVLAVVGGVGWSEGYLEVCRGQGG
jgi:CrcB protein